ARTTRRSPYESARGAVLVLEAVQHDVELQHTHGADDRGRTGRLGARRIEDLRRAFLGELAEAGVELLPLHRFREDDAREMFGGEARDAAELDIRAVGQRVADAQAAAIHHADHVARPRFLDGRAFTRQELLR